MSAYIFDIEHPWYWFLLFAPCKSWILDSTVWILESRYWISDSLAVERGTGIRDSIRGFQIPWAQFPFRKPDYLTQGDSLAFYSSMVVSHVRFSNMTGILFIMRTKSINSPQKEESSSRIVILRIPKHTKLSKLEGKLFTKTMWVQIQSFVSFQNKTCRKRFFV